jgi:hypothetical protein
MVRTLFAALLVIASSAPVLAQPPGAPHPTAALTWLTGSWRGGGTMFGSASEARLVVSPALGGRFLEFSYLAGPFEGRAFYRPAPDGGWQAQWLDNRGVTFPIAAQIEARTLTSEWGEAATERGRTVYRLADDGRLHVTDSVRRPDGSYRDFASHILSRAD